MTVPTSSRRVALAIGNSAYAHALPLRNPRQDAEAMAKVLRNLGFEVTLGLDATRNEMEDLIIEFENQIRGAEAALLFYAGHGIQVKGLNYLLPVDAQLRQEAHLKFRAFALNQVLDVMTRGAGTSLVFLDACRDNPFAGDLARAMAVDGEATRSFRSGLAKVQASRGSFIAFATAPDAVALDGTGDNSPFAKALVEHIGTENLPVASMMIRVRQAVLEATQERQDPWDQSNLRREFFFRPPISVADAKSPTKPPGKPTDQEVEGLAVEERGTAIELTRERETERVQWEALGLSQVPHEYEAFLARYPNGIYAMAARRRLDHLLARQRRLARLRNGIAVVLSLLVLGILLWAGGHSSRDQEPEERSKLGRAAPLRGPAELEPPADQVTHGRERKNPWALPRQFPFEPEMMVLPAGSFVMGSEIAEGGEPNESPTRTVTVAKPFAIGKFEVTFNEWDTCVAEGGCSEYKPDDNGWGRGRRPVINVSWDDAKTYVTWLNRKVSGRADGPYRLPSESEWEYAARARTTTRFSTGPTIGPDQANYNPGPSGLSRQRTVEVSSFPPNLFGLHNVHGNVREWVEDCWHENYVGAPKDNSPWLGELDGDCSKRVRRGGAWSHTTYPIRSAFRQAAASGERDKYTGFRLARTLDP